MTQTKSGLSYFEDGGSSSEPTTEKVAPTSKAAVPIKAGKYSLPVYSAAVPVGESVLENMQKLIAEKQAQQESWQERLRDAKAWFTGMGATQAQALHDRAQEREQRAADIFNMQTALAQYQAAQELAQRKRQSFADQIGIGGGTAVPNATAGGTTLTGTAGTGAPVGNFPAGFSPDVKAEVLRLAQDPQRSDEAEAIYQKELSRLADARAKGRYDASGAKQETYIINGRPVTLTPSQFNEARDSGVLPDGTPFNASTVVQPGTQRAVATPDATSRNNNPGNIKYGDFAKSQGAVGADDRGFAIFKDETAGANAQHNLLSGKYGTMKLKDIASTWAPAGDGANNPAAYTNAIQKITGFSNETMDKPYNQLTPDQQYLFRAAQKRIEQGAGSAPSSPIPGDSKASTVPTFKTKEEYNDWLAVNKERSVSEAKKTGEAVGDALTHLRTENEKADSVIAAADRVLALADDKKLNKVMGYLHGGDKTATWLATIPTGAAALVGQKDTLEEAIKERAFNDDELAAYQALKTDATQLGIEYTANMFKGARLGIGLEKLGLQGKGVSPDFLPKTNKLYAQLAKDAATFERAKNDMYKEWAQQHGQGYQEFLDSPEYKKFRDEHRDILLSRYKGILKPESTAPSKSAAPKEGDVSKDKNGRATIFRNGKWVYQ